MTRTERWIPYFFLFPALALLVGFRIAPALAGLSESLFTKNLSRVPGARQFVGLANFAHVLQDPIFWRSLKATMYFSAIVNPLQVTVALALAVLANQRVRSIQLFRGILLLPMVISINVTAIVWGLMLHPTSGMVNGVLGLLGLPHQPFLASASQALWAIILICAWVGCPYDMVFFLAGLQGIPESVMEAAAIDGANKWQSFFLVTLPLLRRIVLFVLSSGTIINFFLFAPVYLLTKGGPDLSTNLLMYDAYRRGFVWADLGSSGAMIMLLLAVVVAVVAVQFRLLRED
jgi:ABC-type sugar transport system permease subunit